MSAAKTDQACIDLENALAWLTDGDDHCRVAMLKLSQWAKTAVEGDILVEVMLARQAINEAKQTLSGFWNPVAPSRG